jgi:hypothetical protein
LRTQTPAAAGRDPTDFGELARQTLAQIPALDPARRLHAAEQLAARLLNELDGLYQSTALTFAWAVIEGHVAQLELETILHRTHQLHRDKQLHGTTSQYFVGSFRRRCLQLGVWDQVKAPRPHDTAQHTTPREEKR